MQYSLIYLVIDHIKGVYRGDKDGMWTLVEIINGGLYNHHILYSLVANSSCFLVIYSCLVTIVGGGLGKGTPKARREADSTTTEVYRPFNCYPIYLF